MNDAVYRLGTLTFYGFGVLATFSFLWGAFVFFKKAVESHFEELHVLDGIILSAFWSFITGRLFFVLFNLNTFWGHFPRIFLFSNFPGIDRWGALVGIYLGILWTAKKLKAKPMDWFDLVSLGSTSGMTIFYAGLSLLTYSWKFALISLLNLVAFIYFWGVEEKYRTYSWYKANKTSAKSGFITGFSMSLWGVTFILEKFLSGRPSPVELLWGIGLFVGGLILVYIRSGRTVSEDIKIILKHGRK